MKNPKTMEKMFSAPQPGQSLTAEPGSRPWEKPPQFVDPDEAFLYVMERMTKPKVTTKMLNLFKKGVPVNSAVDMILQSGVMEGKWSVDLATVIAEPTAALMMRIARDAGVKYTTRSRLAKPDYGTFQSIDEVGMPSPAPKVNPELQSAAEQDGAPQGIMSRRGKK